MVMSQVEALKKRSILNLVMTMETPMSNEKSKKACIRPLSIALNSLWLNSQDLKRLKRSLMLRVMQRAMLILRA